MISVNLSFNLTSMINDGDSGGIQDLLSYQNIQKMIMTEYRKISGEIDTKNTLNQLLEDLIKSKNEMDG